MQREQSSYERPLSSALSESGPSPNLPNPDIHGRHASDFCIKRWHDFRGFEPDADLVIFASRTRKVGGIPDIRIDPFGTCPKSGGPSFER